MHYGALKVAEFLAGNTVQKSRLHLWPIYPERVEFSFNYIGVDYFEPLEVKYMSKTMKRLACVLTGLSTRAIHLEMVYSLDTDFRLSALTRFIAAHRQFGVIMEQILLVRTTS